MPIEREDAVWLHTQAQLSILEVAQSSGLSQELLRDLVECGALSLADSRSWTFSADCVVRLRTAARLCSDFELEDHALALVLSFLERIEELQAEVHHLSAQLAPPRR